MATKDKTKKAHSTTRKASVAKAGKRRTRKVQPPVKDGKSLKDRELERKMWLLELEVYEEGLTRNQTLRLGLKYLPPEKVAEVTSKLFRLNGELIYTFEEWVAL